jgi:hypothetical protein
MEWILSTTPNWAECRRLRAAEQRHAADGAPRRGDAER